LAGARDIPSVIDARLRRQAGSLVPLPAGSWSAQLPQIPDPGRRAFAAEIAELMDERKDRIGEHAATSAPAWERQLAIAADAELRRRHPGQHYAPLRSAEPEPDTRDQCDEPALSAEDDLRHTEELLAQVAAQRRELARALAERNGPLLPARRPRPRKPRPGVPDVGRRGQGRDPAAAQAPDRAVSTGTRTGHQPRPGPGSRRLVTGDVDAGDRHAKTGR
jgi:hypothetical protein